jgi:hypothetical protein
VIFGTFTPPPEPILGEPSPTYLANDGMVWRRDEYGWHMVDAYTASRLLACFRNDARNTGDWFHRIAAQHADELERAIAEVQQMEQAA